MPSLPQTLLTSRLGEVQSRVIECRIAFLAHIIIRPAADGTIPHQAALHRLCADARHAIPHDFAYKAGLERQALEADIELLMTD